MEGKLAFIDYIGIACDDRYIYRFDFTNDADSVWGDYFNVSPTVIIPDLQPDKATISFSARVNFTQKLNLAKKNGCFSMQDCFDGIIPLAFTELTEEDTYYFKDRPLYFDFGEDFSLVEEKIKSLGFEFYDIVNNATEDDEQFDELIKNITEEKNDVTTDDEEELTLVKDDYPLQEVVHLKVGEEQNFEELKVLLFDSGYAIKDFVSKEGEYAVRGNIFDIYSYNETYPFRVVFFENTVESIKRFNESEQSVIDSVDEAIIYEKVLF